MLFSTYPGVSCRLCRKPARMQRQIRLLALPTPSRARLRKLPTGRGHSPGGERGGRGYCAPPVGHTGWRWRRPVPGQVIEVRSPRSQLKLKHRRDHIYIYIFTCHICIKNIQRIRAPSVHENAFDAQGVTCRNVPLKYATRCVCGGVLLTLPLWFSLIAQKHVHSRSDIFSFPHTL